MAQYYFKSLIEMPKEYLITQMEINAMMIPENCWSFSKILIFSADFTTRIPWNAESSVGFAVELLN